MTTDRIGSYIIESVVGEGAFGRVLRGRHEASGYVRALKVPRAAAYLGNFAEEARLLDRLVHPNVVRFYEFHLGEPAYLVFEYVDGENLAQRLRGGPLPWREAVGIVEQVLEGLQAAHDLGVFHRDLKPANILLGREGEVKIADFGLGRVVAEASLAASTASMARGQPVTGQSLTQSLGEGEEAAAESLAGTWAYMSPEQQQGEAVDARSDLYAAGVILYEMLTGRRPQVSRDMVGPSERLEVVPQCLDEFVLSCFNRPDRRPQSARAMREALQALVEQELARRRVACPECGMLRDVEAGDQFTCPRCGREHLCTAHWHAERGMCRECGQALGALEARRRAEAQACASAREALGKHDYTWALECLEEVFRSGKTGPDVYALRAAIHYQAGRHSSAVDDCTKALGAAPQHARVRRLRAAALRCLGRANAATDDCTQVLGVDPHYVGALLTRAAACCDKGAYAQALSDCDHALGIDPNSARAHFVRAVALQGARRWDEAVRTATNALDRGADPGPCYEVRALGQLATGRVADAEGDLQRALEAGHDTPAIQEALEALGGGHRGDGRRAGE